MYADGRTDGPTGAVIRTDTRAKREMEERTQSVKRFGQRDEWMDRLKEENMNGRTKKRTNGRMNGTMNGRPHERSNARTHERP